jgi:hypothetical protein
MDRPSENKQSMVENSERGAETRRSSREFRRKKIAPDDALPFDVS